MCVSTMERKVGVSLRDDGVGWLCDCAVTPHRANRLTRVVDATVRGRGTSTVVWSFRNPVGVRVGTRAMRPQRAARNSRTTGKGQAVSLTSEKRDAVERAGCHALRVSL